MNTLKTSALAIFLIIALAACEKEEITVIDNTPTHENPVINPDSTREYTWTIYDDWVAFPNYTFTLNGDTIPATKGNGWPTHEWWRWGRPINAGDTVKLHFEYVYTDWYPSAGPEDYGDGFQLRVKCHTLNTDIYIDSDTIRSEPSGSLTNVHSMDYMLTF
tara:strand:+ start:7863 stop:8345 length:483 start_codon:yes stop_codon:yes gene_type:complete